MPRKKAERERLSRPPSVDTDLLTSEIQADLVDSGVLIRRGDDYHNVYDLRRPCGLVDIDIATGGGLPPGLNQIDGPDGAGKNYLLNRYFAMAQRMYGDDFRGFMVCMEYSFDKEFAMRAGFTVPMSEYEVAVEQRKRASEGKEAMSNEDMAAHLNAKGKFYIIESEEAESALDAVIRYTRSNGFQIGAIDSWDSMLTSPEAEANLEDDARIARAATVQTQWMKKMQGALKPRRRCPVCMNFPLNYKKHGHGTSISCPECNWSARKGDVPFLESNETTIIGIRQVRANLKAGMYGRAYKVGGAWSLKHGKLIDIQLRPGRSIEVQKEKVGKEIFWELIKGKAGTHEGAKGSFKYYYDDGADVVDVLTNYCLSNDVVTREGRELVFEEYSWSKKDDFIDDVEDDTELRTLLYRSSLVGAGLGHIRHA